MRWAAVARRAALAAAIGSRCSADLGNVAEIGDVHVGCERAPARIDDHQSLVGEPLERLPNRRAADVE